MNRELKTFKRVVVYRIGSLGDTLVVLPAFHLVRRAFPEAHITLLTNIPVHAKATPMEAVLGGGDFYDDVLRYPVSLREFAGLVHLRKELKEGAYDCLVYLASPKGGLITSVRDYLFFRLCGIPKVLGVPFSRSTLRSQPIPGTDLYTSRTSRALEALNALGAIDVRDPQAWDLRLTGSEIAEAEGLLARHGISSPFLAVSAGTKMPAKDWEEPNWTELIRRLAVEFPGLPLVLLGVHEEQERSERLMGWWPGPKANLCGLTSPRVGAAVLRSAAAMVGHDSGPMHLAATMAVPCIAIFSARAKPGEWFPQGDQHTVLYHQTPCWDCGLEECLEKRKVCILSITVDEVFEPVVQHLARRGLSARSAAAAHAGASAGREGPASIGAPEFRKVGALRRLPVEPTKLRVLLVGNYESDGQQSMQRFATVMARELTGMGVDVTLIRPEPFFGRLRPGPSGLGKWLSYLDKFLLFPILLRRRLSILSTLDSQLSTGLVVHICDHSNAFYTRWLQDVPHVVTCHDLLAVRSALGEIPQNRTRWSGRLQQRLIGRGLARARRIVGVSKATQRDLARVVPGADARSSVVRMGLNAPFQPVPKDEARARVWARLSEVGSPLPADGRYLVHVGDDSWYKNRKGVLEMFGELRRFPDTGNLFLVMVGKPLSPALRDFLRDEGLADWVRELSGVAHEDLCAVYSAAELLLFPSLQEGFGWPIIEAQACGCPVVTTGRPPMNEVGGAGATYLDPGDLWASAEIILNVLYADEVEKRALIERGLANAARYSTRQMIEAYRQTYLSVAKPVAMIPETDQPMCGIAAVITRNGPARPMDLELLKHRGPDGRGEWFSPDGRVWLGHTRLAIVDLSPTGAQPMPDPETGNVIIFNGEIYNHGQLRAELREAGGPWRGTSDTETLLVAYRLWGERMLKRLKGMFALTIFDAASRELFIARGPTGIKPLYYVRSPGMIRLASEARPLFSGAASIPDERSVGSYLQWGTCPETQFVFPTIKMLPAGHWMRVRPDTSVETGCFWPEKSYPQSAPAGAPARVRKLVEKAVEEHLMADVPVAAFLSGGIDSSVITAVAARAMGAGRLRTFSVGFSDADFDESDVAAEVAQRYGTEHLRIELGAEEIIGLVQEAVIRMDAPSVDAINTYIVSKKVADQGIKVALSGLGGDELFGGYPSFREAPLLRRFAAIPASVRQLFSQWGKLGARLADLPSGVDLFQIAIWRRRFWTDAMLRRAGLPLSALHAGSPPELGDDFARISWAEMGIYMRQMLLRDADQMSMAVSLELRVPFLDRELIEYALSLPAQEKTRYRIPKGLLVEAFRDLLPERVYQRPKMGFALPMDAWMRGPLRSFSESGLDEMDRLAILAPGTIAWIRREFAERKIHWTRIWSLVVLGHYLRNLGVGAGIETAAAMSAA